MIDIENDFDVAVLKFIKVVYEQSGYDKERVRALLNTDVVNAVMKTIDITERGIEDVK
ncbi:hypothetical protein [Rodentibacter trehalosifermentans]|uniref:hypothetical protein n=1 Tax=Rodentibacter trehalosifermentans TaxID=1908263 RepID=UPI0015C39876|nr:hypothetical protein [Rodentibacter trehalosifermentans]